MVIVKITFVWVVSTAISCPVLVYGFSDYTNLYIDGDCTPRIRNFVIYGSVFAFYVPLLTMVLTHGLTIRTLRRTHSAMLRYVDGKLPTERATVTTHHGHQQPNTLASEEGRQRRGGNIVTTRRTEPATAETYGHTKVRPVDVISTHPVVTKMADQDQGNLHNLTCVHSFQDGSFKQDVPCNVPTCAGKRCLLSTSQPHLPSVSPLRRLSTPSVSHDTCDMRRATSYLSVRDRDSADSYYGPWCVTSLNSVLTRQGVVTETADNDTWSDTDEPHIVGKLTLIENEMDECLTCRSPGGTPFVDDGDRHSILPTDTYTEHVPLVYSGPLQCAVCMSFVGKKDSSRSHIIKSAYLGKSATSDNYILSNCCISNNGDSANIILRDTMSSSSARRVVPVRDRNNSSTTCLAKDTLHHSSQDASFDGFRKTTDGCITPTSHPTNSCVSHPPSGSTNVPRPDDTNMSSNNRFTDSDCPSPCNQYNMSPRDRYDTMLSPTAAPMCGKNRLIRFLRRERAAHWRMFGCVHRRKNKRDSVYIPRRMLTNERKASKVLGIIVAVFLVLWTPFFVMNILSVVCPLCMSAVTSSMSSSIVWLGYLSSLANPVIYTMFNTAFRQAFYRILTCQYRRQSAFYYNKTAESTCLSNSMRQRSQHGVLSRHDV